MVIDLETAGLDAGQHALLEFAAVSVRFDEHGKLLPNKTWHYHIEPFQGSVLDAKALDINRIDPTHPFRFAISELDFIQDWFPKIQEEAKAQGCERAILVAHNPFFDRGFLLAACERNGIHRYPFHSFSTIDTASLAALIFGQTVLAQALRLAHIGFDPEQAHGALYDATQTAELFCWFVNEIPLRRKHGRPQHNDDTP